jgi:hypothetical protein
MEGTGEDGNKTRVLVESRENFVRVVRLTKWLWGVRRRGNKLSSF